jgi:hypothetical protein
VSRGLEASGGHTYTCRGACSATTPSSLQLVGSGRHTSPAVSSPILPPAERALARPPTDGRQFRSDEITLTHDRALVLGKLAETRPSDASTARARLRTVKQHIHRPAAAPRFGGRTDAYMIESRANLSRYAFSKPGKSMTEQTLHTSAKGRAWTVVLLLRQGLPHETMGHGRGSRSHDAPS